jgi:hypothetical protein
LLNVAHSVEKKLQAAEDGSTQMRNAGVEVLAELQNRLEVLSEDQSAQRNLNITILDLREENATLKEKLRTRDAKFSGIERQFNEAKQELQKCRAQLTTTTDDLGKSIAASREDASLRTQLQDQQKSYSIAKAQAESSASETERLKADLHEQEKLAILAKQEISKLQDELRQSEAKVSAFDNQKEAYVRHVKDESNKLRLKMEGDLKVRLEDVKTRHNDDISGLRRQIAEANNNLCQSKRKLQDMEKMGSNKEAETHSLSAQISALTTELGSLQYNARSMEQDQDRTGDELRISQEQFIQYMDKAAEWSSRVEENALEFARRCKEIDDGFKKSREVAEAEVDRLGALVSMLQKKSNDSDIVNSNVACYLRSKGLLALGITFTEWALRLPSENSQQEEMNLVPSIPSVPGELTTLGSESYSHGSQNKAGTSTFSGRSNKQMPLVVPDDAQLVDKYTSCTTNPSYALLEEDRRRKSLVNDSSLLSSYLISSSKSIGRDTSEHEHHLNTRTVEINSASRAPSNVSHPFPATEAIPRSYLQASDYFHGSNARLSGTKNLGGIARTVIPDSQEELTQEQIPAFTQPTRRVAERRHSKPHLRDGKRTVTRTEFTEYSIQTSEMYDDTPTLQCDANSGLRFSDPAINSKPVDSDDESSDLSEPPDNMENADFTEYLDDSSGNARRDPEILRVSNKKVYAQSETPHSAPSPKPNSSRVRARPPVQTKEIKPPKSILKRTNVVTRNDTSADTLSNGKLPKNTQPSKAQGARGRSAAKRLLSRTGSGTNGIDGASHGSSYNRIVSGNRATQNSGNFHVLGGPSQGQGPSATDIISISSSPAMGQPQRNTKKRALSGVGFNDNSRPSKLQRSARH